MTSPCSIWGRQAALGRQLVEVGLVRVEARPGRSGLLGGGEADPVEDAPLRRVETDRVGVIGGADVLLGISIDAARLSGVMLA